MRAALICGSPKRRGSASSKLLDVLQLRLGQDAEVARLGFGEKVVSEDDLAQLGMADAWVFSFPLYVDGIPGHLLSCLEQICEHRDEYADVHIFALVNCGFYEGIQNELALEVLKNWCDRCGFAWSGGVGIGGGPALGIFSAEGFGKGPTSPVNEAIEMLSKALVAGGSIFNTYPSIAIPRFAYKFAAERSWRSTIKANGGKPRDLGRRL